MQSTGDVDWIAPSTRGSVNRVNWEIFNIFAGVAILFPWVSIDAGSKLRFEGGRWFHKYWSSSFVCRERDAHNGYTKYGSLL